jgi:hypothetical protein
MSNYTGSNKHVIIQDDSGIFSAVSFPDASDGSVTFHYEKGSASEKANL